MSLLSELLRSTVTDVEGREVGDVNDVRLVQDGPLLDGFGAALRIDGLVIGAASLSVRLGYHRHQVKGPPLLKAIFGALERRARFAPWKEVEHWDGTVVRLRCRASDLPSVHEVS
jgi:hypothetical protein